MSRKIKVLYGGGGGGVVGEVDSHYDYRHKIYSLHNMSYGFGTKALKVVSACLESLAMDFRYIAVRFFTDTKISEKCSLRCNTRRALEKLSGGLLEKPGALCRCEI